MRYTVVLILTWMVFTGCNDKPANRNRALYTYDDLNTRWSSPENKNGSPGNGGRENNHAKGHPYDSIPPGASLDLLNIQDQGIIQRIWITIDDRKPDMLRALKIEMYWDNEQKPAVSVPFGDFFGIGLGRTLPFQNIFFANPEGRSFNCFIPMPFKKAARIVLVNESDRPIRKIFYDIDFALINTWNDEDLYFHACWNRDTATTPGVDFNLLPPIKGRGRFLGVNIGVHDNPVYGKSWFGEGEVKMYLDEDSENPTLNGTGTEDYIGSAWGQGKFINTYTGCTIADDSLRLWAFYRYHIPDPVYFRTGCRVAMQQIGGDMTAGVEKYQRNGAPLIPLAIDTGRMILLFEQKKTHQIDSTQDPKGWVNFYRSDDVSATSYFYLNAPADNLPALQNVKIRTWRMD